MKKQLEEIERNMESILEEVNNIGFDFHMFSVELWPKFHKPFHYRLWDGKDHAMNKDGNCGFFNNQDLIDWVERKQILFQKFDFKL